MTMRRDAAKREMRALEASCQAQLQQLDAAIHLRDIPDVRALCDAIGTHRMRPISLEALPLSGQQTGFCIAGESGDTIYFDREASPPYQAHIILHELAHLLRKHVATSPEVAELVQQEWFPLLDPQRLRHLVARSRYDFAHEREAELFASLLEQRWRRARRQHGEDYGTPPAPAIQWLREQACDTT